VREPDPSDRRMLLVHLTKKAEDFLRRYLPIHFRGASEVMASLDEGERKTLVQLLTKIQQCAASVAVVPPAAKTA